MLPVVSEMTENMPNSCKY